MSRRALAPAAPSMTPTWVALALAVAAPDPAPAQQLYDFGTAFGRALAVSGSDVLVAEPQTVLNPGRIHVFRRSAGDWSVAQALVASDGARADGFGRALAADGSLLLVGAPQAADGQGAAYVFARTGDGWRETARLAAAEGGRAFGSAVALAGDVAAVAERDGDGERVRLFRRTGDAWRPDGVLTAEGDDRRVGAALAAVAGTVLACGSSADGNVALSVFASRAGSWERIQRLTVPVPLSQTGGLLSQDPYLECALEARGDRVALGTPLADGGVGRVTLYRQASDGRLEVAGRLEPFAPAPGLAFGTSVALADGAVWVGAPNARGMLGVTYRFEQDAEGLWTSASLVPGGGRDFMPVFGLAAAAAGDLAVVGSPGDDYGAGTAAVFARGPAGWEAAGELEVEGERYEGVAGRTVGCAEGAASVFGCSEVDLVSFIPVQEMGASRGAMVNDVWGWTDPQTGREYAIVGRSDGTSFVDVTDPASPRYLGQMPKTEGSRGNAWRDVKVLRDHALVVADNAGAHGMQVFDLTRLRDPGAQPVTFEPDALYTGIGSAHNLGVNEASGFAYTVGNSGGGNPCGSLHIIDLRDPKNPRFAGCYTDPAVGLSGSGSTHDTQCVEYRGPDERYTGREICFGFSETAISIGDVTDKAAARVLSQARFPGTAYIHQGWLTDDHRYLYVNDELDEMSGLTERTRTFIWDVSELDEPVLAGEYLGETSATDHNLYVRGNLMYQSNYAAGLRIIDISDPVSPREVGFFDTAPFSDDVPGFFDGSWSNYPFFESGNILVTSHKQGLFVVRRSRPVS